MYFATWEACAAWSYCSDKTAAQSCSDGMLAMIILVGLAQTSMEPVVCNFHPEKYGF